jgi:hypothetical protein
VNFGVIVPQKSDAHPCGIEAFVDAVSKSPFGTKFVPAAEVGSTETKNESARRKPLVIISERQKVL